MGILKRTLLSAIVIFGYAAALAYHFGSMREAVALPGSDVLLCIVANVFSVLMQASATLLLIRIFDEKIAYRESLQLTSVSIVAGYLPLHVGTLFRAQYARTRFGISFVDCGIAQVVVAMLSNGFGGIVALLALIFLPQTNPSAPSWILPTTFILLTAALPICGAVLFIASTHHRRKTGPFALLKQIAKPSRFALLTVFVFLNLVALCVRIYGAGHMLPDPARLFTALSLPSISFATSIVGITPGGLGLRELLADGLTRLQGLSPGMGLATATVDRLFQLGTCFIIGAVTLGMDKYGKRRS